METKEITKGFTAIKNKESIKVEVEIYELGLYIYIFENSKLKDQTARKNIKKAEQLVNEYKTKALKKGFVITELGKHKVKLDPKTLTLYT